MLSITQPGKVSPTAANPNVLDVLVGAEGKQNGVYYFLGNALVGTASLTHFVIGDWAKFQCLARNWSVERGSSSSISEGAMCPSYQAIIGMGEKAIPLIMAQLQAEGNDPDQWFWALQAITGNNPVKPEDQGNFAAMAKSWLEWAKNEGHVW